LKDEPLASLAVSHPAARRLTAAQSPQNFFSFSFGGARKKFFQLRNHFAGFASLLTQR